MRHWALLALVALLLGCGARVEVAKEKLVAKIDSLLGELDVKRKEVELSVAALQEGVDGLRKAKVKAQVKQDQIARQISPLQDKLADIDAALAKVRDPLASNSSAEIGGKAYSADELKAAADKMLAARKQLLTQMEGLKKSETSLQGVVDSMERKQGEYQQRLTQLESQIAEIDSKSIALKAMQDASIAMGESDKTMAENIAALEDKVNDLYASVEVELLSEDEKWNSAAVTEQIDSADAIILASKSTPDTLTEIDAILSGIK